MRKILFTIIILTFASIAYGQNVKCEGETCVVSRQYVELATDAFKRNAEKDKVIEAQDEALKAKDDVIEAQDEAQKAKDLVIQTQKQQIEKLIEIKCPTTTVKFLFGVIKYQKKRCFE